MDSVQAQDPIYKLVSHRTTAQPWRPVSSSRRKQQRATVYRQPDYSDRFLDFDQVRGDASARIYQVDFKSRRPNQFSVTSRLVFFTLAAFALQVMRPNVTALGMKLSDRILRGEQLYRTITPIFLHGGIFHLFTNMMSLQRIGNDVEKLFGPGRFLTTYLVAGIAGNVLSAIQSPNPSLGASGAVFGVVGAYMVFLNRNDWLLGDAGQAMTTSIGQTMVMNVFLGLLNPQIDQWAHLGGAVAGGIMAYSFGPRLYLTDIPTGNDGATYRVVVDRPIVRAPAYLESIPGAVATQWQQVTEKLLPTSGISNKNSRPWHKFMGQGRRIDYHMRRHTPNRSIKPGKVD